MPFDCPRLANLRVVQYFRRTSCVIRIGLQYVNVSSIDRFTKAILLIQILLFLTTATHKKQQLRRLLRTRMALVLLGLHLQIGHGPTHLRLRSSSTLRPTQGSRPRSSGNRRLRSPSRECKGQHWQLSQNASGSTVHEQFLSGRAGTTAATRRRVVARPRTMVRQSDRRDEYVSQYYLLRNLQSLSGRYRPRKPGLLERCHFLQSTIERESLWDVSQVPRRVGGAGGSFRI